MSEKKLLKSVVSQREKNNEILITSIIIAFGINIFSIGFLGIFNIEKEYLLLIIIGILFSIIILLIYLLTKIKKENNVIGIEGLIIYNSDNNKIVDIPEYYISNDIVTYLSSAFSENKALANKWKCGKIGICMNNSPLKDDEKIATASNNYIIIELIEYLFLSRLSIALGDYFNINDINKEDIQDLNFDKMPEILRKNRFLKLFSEDMDNREAFIKSKNNIDTPLLKDGNIVYAIGKKGAIFDKFELKLPKEVKIKKTDINNLEFDMKYFNLRVKYVFEGYNTVVDSDFYEYYLNLKYDPIKFNDFNFKINVEVKFKKRILFTNKKMENYMWIDKLLNDLIEYADINEFYNKINWESNKCVMRCSKNKNS